MTGQDFAFYSMIIITLVVVLKWLALKNKQGGGITKIKLPVSGLSLGREDIKNVLKNLTEEPTIKEEITLEQKFVDKFVEMNATKKEIGDKLKAVSRELDDLWEEIREYYKIGDYNLSLSDDKKTLKVKNLSKMEKTLSSFLRR
jgi:hypothetical protein